VFNPWLVFGCGRRPRWVIRAIGGFFRSLIPAKCLAGYPVAREDD
jgi:hypothetical protein